MKFLLICYKDRFWGDWESFRIGKSFATFKEMTEKDKIDNPHKRWYRFGRFTESRFIQIK